MTSFLKFSFLRRVRIHDGECGAVARALHHRAKALRLCLADSGMVPRSTSFERKQMLKTTNFKRLALAVVAALGLGVLSVAPTSAVAGVPTLTVATGSASVTAGNNQETVTAAKVTITGLLSGTTLFDSYSVVMTRKSAPTGGFSNDQFRMFYFDSSTYTTGVRVTDAVGGNVITITENATRFAPDVYDSGTPGSTTRWISSTTSTGGYVGATFGLMLDSHTARTTAGVGTYVYTAIVTPYSGGAAGAATAGTPVTADLTFTVSNTGENLAAAGATDLDPSQTTAILNAGTGTSATSDPATPLSYLSTAGSTTRATIVVKTYDEDGYARPDSVTVTVTGPGLVGTSASGVFGKIITIAGDGEDSILIRSDGTAGVGSFVVSTTGRTFNAKKITFYAKAASTITVTANKPVIGTTSTDAVIRATIKDANGVIWGGTAYWYSTTPTIAGSADPASCTYSATLELHECTVTGKLAGTAKFKVIDASTIATANVTSDEVSVTVSQGTATTAKLSFDKETYAPGEKALLKVTILDENGKAMPEGTYSNVFTAAPAPSSAFGSGSATLTASPVLAGATSAVSETTAGAATYVVYMPVKAGTLTVSAVGSVGLAVAGRVAVSASAKIVDDSNNAAIEAANAASDAALEAIDAANAATDAANLAAEAADAATVAAEEARDAADAATAAVEALATEVATLMAALKAQITTLANTVAKIAKKVKA